MGDKRKMSCKYNNCKHCGYKPECEIYKENLYYKDIIETNTAEWEEQGQRLVKLETENAELKEQNSKAKELIEDLIKFQPYIDREAFFISLGNEWKTAIYKAEQFLKEEK